jgi:hypothetical protein
VFYAYLWLRYDGTPYYVGKSHDGKNSRAFKSVGHHVHRPSEESRIIVQHYDSEDEAFAAEKFLIAFYGRADLGEGCLRNLTDGGEGTTGAIRTEQWKQNISKGLTGKKRTGPQYQRTEEHRRQLRERMKSGDAAKAGRIGGRRMVENLKGRFTLEQRQAWSKKVHAARWGKVSNS